MSDERCGGFSLHMKACAAPFKPAIKHFGKDSYCTQRAVWSYNLIRFRLSHPAQKDIPSNTTPSLY